MNGVSRFLSRRDKHHEKRSSKHMRSKVRAPSPSSPHSSIHLLCSVDGGRLRDYGCPCHPRRRPDCLQSFYHRLPSALQSLLQDGVLLLCKRPPTAELTQCYIQVSTTSSSDHLTLQSRQTSSNVPSDLYRVFTNEDLIITDKDGDKKARFWGPSSAQLGMLRRGR